MTKNNQEKNSSSFPLIKLLPNIITLAGLCIGLSAIRFSINGEWLQATALLVFATFIDGIDGRLARFLESTSEFGAQLDSLADFVNFGIIPGLVIYMWINEYNNIVAFDWAMVLFFSICMAIRLARFNVDSGSEEFNNESLSKYFFKGIPAPCGAGMSMLPMILFHEFGEGYFFTNPTFVISYVFVISLFVASSFPTISIKSIPIRNDYIYPTLAFFGLMIAGFIISPWLTLAVMGTIYAASIPFTIILYLKIKRSENE